MQELVKYRKKLGVDRMQLCKWLGVKYYMELRRYELGEYPVPLKLKENYKKILDEYNYFLNKIKEL
jgi:hypothetical protein